MNVEKWLGRAGRWVWYIVTILYPLGIFAGAFILFLNIDSLKVLTAIPLIGWAAKLSIWFLDHGLSKTQYAITVGGTVGGALYTLVGVVRRALGDRTKYAPGYFVIVYFLGPWIAPCLALVAHLLALSPGVLSLSGTDNLKNVDTTGWTVLGISIGLAWPFVALKLVDLAQKRWEGNTSTTKDPAPPAREHPNVSEGEN